MQRVLPLLTEERQEAVQLPVALAVLEIALTVLLFSVTRFSLWVKVWRLPSGW